MYNIKLIKITKEHIFEYNSKILPQKDDMVMIFSDKFDAIFTVKYRILSSEPNNNVICVGTVR